MPDFDGAFDQMEWPPGGEPAGGFADATSRNAIAIHQEAWDEAKIPQRPWVAKNYLMRGSITVIAGPGSAGKSSLVCAWSAALALGSQFGEFQAVGCKPLRVAVYNVEDDIDEQYRRYSAICNSFGRTPCQLMERLSLITPERVGQLLTVGKDGQVLENTPAMDELEAFIEREKPDALFLDPFVELHGAEENDNTAIRHVMARFRAMARRYNIAICILHHVRKGNCTPGDPDSSRGASSIVGAARVILTLVGMSEDDARKVGVNPDTRRNYCRLDGAKMNYSPLTDAEWFERIGAPLANGETVGALEPWEVPQTPMTQEVISKLIDGIGQGAAGRPYSPKLSCDARSIKHLFELHGIRSDKDQKSMLNILAHHGIETAPYYSRPEKGKRDIAQGLRAVGGEPGWVKWVPADE